MQARNTHWLWWNSFRMSAWRNVKTQGNTENPGEDCATRIAGSNPAALILILLWNTVAELVDANCVRETLANGEETQKFLIQVQILSVFHIFFLCPQHQITLVTSVAIPSNQHVLNSTFTSVSHVQNELCNVSKAIWTINTRQRQRWWSCHQRNMPTTGVMFRMANTQAVAVELMWCHDRWLLWSDD